MNGYWDVSPNYVRRAKPRLRWIYDPQISFVGAHARNAFAGSWLMLALSLWRRR